MTSSMSRFAAPSSDEYSEFYHAYISKFESADFLVDFAAQVDELRSVLGHLDPGEEDRLHEPYTWTLKQVMGHLIDCERIFSTRLLRIAAGDETPIPGMDQNIYVANLDYENVTMSDLLDEFGHLRKANVIFAKRLTPGNLDKRGTASGNPVSARANLYILAGHVVYHLEIIKRRLA